MGHGDLTLWSHSAGYHKVGVTMSVFCLIPQERFSHEII